MFPRVTEMTERQRMPACHVHFSARPCQQQETLPGSGNRANAGSATKHPLPHLYAHSLEEIVQVRCQAAAARHNGAAHAQSGADLRPKNLRYQRAVYNSNSAVWTGYRCRWQWHGQTPWQREFAARSCRGLCVIDRQAVQDFGHAPAATSDATSFPGRFCGEETTTVILP